MANNIDLTEQNGFRQHDGNEAVDTTSTGKKIREEYDQDGNVIATKELYEKKEKTDENKKIHKIKKRVSQAWNSLKNNAIPISGAIVFSLRSIWANGKHYNYVHYLSSNTWSHGLMKTSPIGLALTAAVSFVALRSTVKTVRKIKARGEKCDSKKMNIETVIAGIVVEIISIIITLATKYYLPIDVAISIASAIILKVVDKRLEKSKNQPAESNQVEDREDHTVEPEHIAEGRTR